MKTDRSSFINHDLPESITGYKVIWFDIWIRASLDDKFRVRMVLKLLEEKDSNKEIQYHNEYCYDSYNEASQFVKKVTNLYL